MILHLQDEIAIAAISPRPWVSNRSTFRSRPGGTMAYRIASIDVHKRMLAVVVSDVEVESECTFEYRKFNSTPEQLRSLAAWLLEQEAEEVVMESTGQYWKPAGA